MLEAIRQADTAVFLWLNGWHSPFWDVVMHWVTFRLTWFPFYGLIILLLARKYRWQSIGLVLTLVSIIVLADKTASAVFKPYFQRLRPCYEPAIQHLVHLVDGCGGQYGFVSSHSANTFGLAMALWLLLRKEVKYLGYLFVWAFIVSYSRIYVGVHYPLDLVGGAIIGMVFAVLVVHGYHRVRQRYETRNQFNETRH